MRSRFWQGLLWGGVIGTLLMSVMGPMVRPRKKPLVERSTDAIRQLSRGLLQGVRQVQKRIMNRLD